MLSNESIVAVMAEYGVQIAPKQCDQLRAYMSLLLKWNQAISLTSITDEMQVLKFHFGESAFALSAIHGINGRLADVGSGAGFPGIPLCILGRDIDLTLIESNVKKSVFLSEAVRVTMLDRVTVVQNRFEALDCKLLGKFDVIASRALGRHPQLLSWSGESLKCSGKVVLWAAQENVATIATSAGWLWERPVAIPGSRRRYILAGTPLPHS